MSGASVAQYEALQWAWRLGREYDEVQPYRDHIGKILASIAENGEIDFKRLHRELEEGNY